MDTNPHPDRLYRPADAAKLLGVSVDTIKRWEAAGRITATRTLGGHRRFSADEIQRVKDRGRAHEEATA